MKRIERARELIGVPYLHLGRDFNGIDCVGLLVYADEVDLGVVPAYPRDPVNGELEHNLNAYYGEPLIDRTPLLDELAPGDVVALQYKGPIRHVGLVGDHPAGGVSLIHTDANLGRVTEHRLDAKWLRRIKKVYRP